MDGVVQVGPDRVKPVVSRLSAKAGKAVRVAFRLSEDSRVTVRLTRRGKTVRSAAQPAGGLRLAGPEPQAAGRRPLPRGGHGHGSRGQQAHRSHSVTVR